MNTRRLFWRDVETNEIEEIEMSAEGYLDDWNYELKTDYKTIEDFNKGESFYELFWSKGVEL